jgi:uncharacterized protein YbbC (DUF1343 family)
MLSQPSTQVIAANAAEAAAIKAGDKPSAPGLAPHYPAIQGQNLRGFGWDIDTAFSKPRGLVFPIGSFGHTGFTGTSLWMDPTSDTYVILLANAIHPRGNPPISNLRGELATTAAQILGIGGSDQLSTSKSVEVDCRTQLCSFLVDDGQLQAAIQRERKTLTGIDVLEQTHFAALKDLHHLALFTNQTGLDANGHRTIDILAAPTTHYSLLTLFTPEHGLSAQQDTTHQQSETDQATHLPIISLYGAHDADRRPTHTQLANLDAVIIDLQDAGVHFWTYEAATSYFLEAAAEEQTKYHHDLQIILLDRPNPVGGLAVQGPVSDPDRESYINPMPLPVRHGLTLGELAKYLNDHGRSVPNPDRGWFYTGIHAHLTVIPMQHWQRSQFFADTGLPWVNPSPNLSSPDAALLYPALGLIEYNNLSVGRGTGHPFSFFGAGIPPAKRDNSAATGGQTDTPANIGYPGPSGSGLIGSEKSQGGLTPWFKATEVANYLTARNIPGVAFTPTSETIAETADHYPYHGQTIEAVRVTLTDPRQADTPELGIEILSALHHLYPTQFNLPRAMPLVANQATMDAIARGDDPRSIAKTWQPSLAAFRAATAPYLLYP